MSGPMQPDLLAAASAVALRAEADAAGTHPGRIIARNLRAQLKATPATPADSLPARTWRGMAPAVRTTLVMLASDAPGDVRRLALQPWESFSDSDRASIAACARMMQRELSAAECLF